MKIDLGYGIYMESDGEPRDSQFHRRIIAAQRIPETRAGNTLDLECGHRVRTFGNLAHTNGVVFCTQCRDAAV